MEKQSSQIFLGCIFFFFTLVRGGGRDKSLHLSPVGGALRILNRVTNSAPDNFDYQQYVYWPVQMKLDPYQLFSICTCIYFGLAKFFMKAYTCI